MKNLKYFLTILLANSAINPILFYLFLFVILSIGFIPLTFLFNLFGYCIVSKETTCAGNENPLINATSLSGTFVFFIIIWSFWNKISKKDINLFNNSSDGTKMVSSRNKRKDFMLMISLALIIVTF